MCTASVFALQQQNGAVIDPEGKGGILVRANSAHGDATNCMMCELTERAKQVFCVVVKCVDSGEELLWDYDAVTSDAADPLLRIECRCNGKHVRVDVFGIGYELRKCPGTMMQHKS